MAARQNWVGRKYGLVTIRSQFPGRYVIGECYCGNVKRYDRFNLAYGKTVSCGHDTQPHRSYNRTREYNSWRKMIERCERPDEHHRKYYAGVRVCERWKTSFYDFYLDMGDKPTPRHTIDRYPNKSGNYEPGNCRWATQREQNNNRRPRGSVTGRRAA